MKIGNLIDAFQPAKGAPPNTLGAFMMWCLSGAWPMLILAAGFSALAGAMEAGTAYILGLVIDTSMAEVRTLRAMKRNKLAKTGDSEKRQLITELTLCVKNEKAFGKIADLTTS